MAAQKKTAEVDYSMQEKILALYELQKIDSKIDEINKNQRRASVGGTGSGR